MLRLPGYDAASSQHWADVETGPRLRGTMFAALAIILIAFGGFGAWAAVARLQSAAIGKGEVIVESHRKTVQHLEGGIIKRLLVREGDTVRAGQVLVELEDTQARTTLGILRGQYWAALARQARLEAELRDEREIAFPAELLEATDDPTVAEILERQKTQLQARRQAHEGQIAILGRRIAELRAEIGALGAQEEATAEQVRLVEKEAEIKRHLQEKALVAMTDMLELERSVADRKGRLGELRGSIARARQTIAGTELEIVHLGDRRRAEIAEDLEAVREKIADLSERIVAAEDVLDRLKVLAPAAGVVVAPQFFTPGGVIAPGQPILDLVPQDEQLVVVAQIRPGDIDVVRPGLPAEVRLIAYKRRRIHPVSGTVTYVSADSLTDARTGLDYYEARVELDPESLKELEEVELYPGMPAEVMIVAGERTALDYLISPIMDVTQRAFREQ